MNGMRLALVGAGSLAALGLTYNAADLWRLSPRFSAFFDYRIHGATYIHWLSTRPLSRRLEALLSERALVLSTVGQPVAAWAFVAFAYQSQGWGQFVAATAVFVLAGYQRYRLSVGLDGSDQMQGVLWASLAVASVPHVAPGVRNAALLFLLVQVTLAYLVSGVAKLGSEVWRQGFAVREILSTREYGVGWVQRAVQPLWASWLAGWTVILFEVAGPLLLLAGGRAAYGFLLAGLAFHLFAWLVMGLRSFVFAFVATYPVVLVALEILPWVG